MTTSPSDAPGASADFDAFSIELPDEAIEREWTELAATVGAPFWCRPGWFAAWGSAFAPGEPLVLHGVRRAGRLAAAGVFLHRTGRIEAAANVHSPWFDVVAESPEARAAAVRAVLAAVPKVCVWPQLQGAGPCDLEVEHAARDQGRHVVRRVVERAPFVSVRGEWDAYCHLRPGSKLLKDVRRRRKRLAERGSVSVEWLAPPAADLDALLAEGLRVEAGGWKARQGTAILARPDTAAFYTSIARFGAANGWLRLGFLRLDGRPIAFDLAFEQDGVVSLLKGGFDESLSRFGPGIMLLSDEIEAAFARPVSEVDLLGGSDPYKLRWAHGTRDRVMVKVFAAPPAGRLAAATSAASLVMRRIAGRWLRRRPSARGRRA